MIKNKPANAGDIRDIGSIPGLGRSPGGGHGNPLQYSCLENPTDRGAQRAMVHRVAKSQTQLKQLSTQTRAMPKVMVLGDKAFGNRSRHHLVNRISTLMRGLAEFPLPLSLGWGTERGRQSAAENRVSSRAPPCGHLLLDFQPLKLVRSEFLLSVLLTEMFRQSSFQLPKTCPALPIPQYGSQHFSAEEMICSLRDQMNNQGCIDNGMITFLKDERSGLSTG